MLDVNLKMRNIPAIDKLMFATEEDSEMSVFPRELVVKQLRAATDRARALIMQGYDADVSVEGLIAQTKKRLSSIEQPSLRRVVNAAGVVLHTNLGRAPLALRAAEAVSKVMTGYSTLEFNVEDGQRGSRYSHVADRVCQLTGAEDALVVNNNAAAELLVLSALASGKEVIVSRGELVEIGGSFRVPDVMKQSGATLVEVGATNKTHLSDYRNAINANTVAILKVHTSNYRIIGFTAQADDAELKNLAKEYNIPLIEDLGSGTLLPISVDGWREPSVTERLTAGMDLVTFSGDKLLGAGQAGIIAGRKEYIAKMKKHPLLRAIRIDKLSLAALEGTLIEYQIGKPYTAIPVHRYLSISIDELKQKAERLGSMLKHLIDFNWKVELLEINSQAGGGSLPGANMPSFGIGLKAPNQSAASLELMLRKRSVPIVVRIQNDIVIIDVRCLEEDDMETIQHACKIIAKGEAM